jgi:hypothetical protein
MTMKQLTSMTLTISLFALGCSGDDQGASVGLSVQAVTSTGATSPGELAMTDDGDGDFALLAAYLNLRHIELDLPDGSTCSDIDEQALAGATCDSAEDKIEIAGPFEIDLVAGTSTPSLDDVQIPAGVYKRIDFRVENNADDVSFSATAGFEHNGDALTLELSLDFNEDIRIEEANGVEVGDETDLVAEFVVDNWLGGVDIGTCLDDGNVERNGDTVTVDDSSTTGNCSDIENTIKDNMKNSGQFDRD